MMMLQPLLYVVTGALNVLFIKWSDNLQGECSDGMWRPFQHPILQTGLMFFAQVLCLILYKIVYLCLQRRGDGSEDMHALTRGGREFSPLSFLLPAFLDAVTWVMLFSGLYLTYASSFQMIRGVALVFVGIFGSIYLNQTLIARHWMAMFTILCGVTVVISIDMQRVYYDNASLPHVDENAILTGNLLIVCAQIVHAAKAVYEEKLLKDVDTPALQATGWQGIFGLGITVVLAACMNFLPTKMPFDQNTRGVFDDFGDILPQLRSNSWIAVALSLFVVSCAVCQAVSLSIVKYSSSANRILADGLCVVYVWVTVVILEWENLNLITVMGFIILQMGAIAYRNAIFIEWYRSLLGRLQRRRYVDLTADQGNDAGAVPTNRPADVI